MIRQLGVLFSSRKQPNVQTFWLYSAVIQVLTIKLMSCVGKNCKEVFMNAFTNTWQCIRIRIRIHCHFDVFTFVFAFIENGSIRIRIRIHFECIHPIPASN